MHSVPILALIAYNAVPLWGVVFDDWSLFSVMALYWFENIVVGLYNVLRMLQAKTLGEKLPYQGPFGSGYTNNRIFLIPFFIVHYGFFMLIHGIFVFHLFGPSEFAFPALLFGGIATVLSHGVSHLVNFIGNAEYRNVTVTSLFVQPYRRMVPLHVGIILGGWGLMLLGTPITGLLTVIVIKTALDVLSHRREHRVLLSA